MTQDLAEKIARRVVLEPSLEVFPVASLEVVEEAEVQLGFRLPAILRIFYLQIGNGYTGSSCDILGLKAGCRTDLGNLLEVYPLLKEGQESEGREWPLGLLPFCSWGCHIYSCVNCSDSTELISTFEDFRLWPQNYSLEQFFEWWVAGVDILRQKSVETKDFEITNPFTKKKSRLQRRKRPPQTP